MTTTSNDSLARLALVIESRKVAHGGDPGKSYVARLLDQVAPFKPTLHLNQTVDSIAAQPDGRSQVHTWTRGRTPFSKKSVKKPLKR